MSSKHATGQGERREVAFGFAGRMDLFFAMRPSCHKHYLQSTSILLAICKHSCQLAGINENAEPKLAPPGAGLPKIELLIARFLFARRLRRGTRESFNADFQQEREVIRALVRSCDAGSASRRVLIKRPRGMEDSSRNWSVWMTLDHLRIVNGGITRTIGSLAKGIVPPGKASTAAVKPSPEVTAAVVAAYEASCDALLAQVAAAPDLKTAGRFSHPWFGPLDACGWHAMAASHMGVHRVQIERIIAGLVPARDPSIVPAKQNQPTR
jgi:hypothetical protein